MNDLLIHRIRVRANVRDTQTDAGDSNQPAISPVLSQVALHESEEMLGFPIPSLLAEVYAKVGNGGFGPGYGLLGLVGGAVDDQGCNAIAQYSNYIQADPSDPSWRWPLGLLPICHWGCAIYSCVDVSVDQNPVVAFDPNLYEDSWSRCFLPHNRNLEQWLVAWASGVNLWKELYEEQ